jgi:hypothetical protein
MFDHMMKYIAEEGQFASGAVDRTEFERSYGDDDNFDPSDPPDRVKLSRFVLRNTPSQHRYKTAEGAQGIVYFDSRGRAASCALEEIPLEDLVRIAHECSKRFPGEVNHDRPKTGRRKHGYAKPVQEGEEPLAD